jgi:hypothetical protein
VVDDLCSKQELQETLIDWLQPAHGKMFLSEKVTEVPTWHKVSDSNFGWKCWQIFNLWGIPKYETHANGFD